MTGTELRDERLGFRKAAQRAAPRRAEAQLGVRTNYFDVTVDGTIIATLC